MTRGPPNTYPAFVRVIERGHFVELEGVEVRPAYEDIPAWRLVTLDTAEERLEHHRRTWPREIAARWAWGDSPTNAAHWFAVFQPMELLDKPPGKEALGDLLHQEASEVLAEASEDWDIPTGELAGDLKGDVRCWPELLNAVTVGPPQGTLFAPINRPRVWREEETRDMLGGSTWLE